MDDATARVMRAQIAAHSRWAQTPDRAAATAAARKGMLDRFERQVDPDGTLDPAERAKLAESARKAFYLRLSLKSAQARNARAKAAALETEIAAALDETDGS